MNTPNEDQVKGSMKEAEGKTQRFVGNVKEKIQEGTYNLGDSIEKVGRKIQEKGYEKVGRTIEKAGDHIEHLAD